MGNKKIGQHIILIIAKDNIRFLAKAAGLLARYGVKAEMLNLTRIQSGDLTFINIILKSDSERINQLKKKFEKMIETIEVQIIEP